MKKVSVVIISCLFFFACKEEPKTYRLTKKQIMDIYTGGRQRGEIMVNRALLKACQVGQVGFTGLPDMFLEHNWEADRIADSVEFSKLVFN